MLCALAGSATVVQTESLSLRGERRTGYLVLGENLDLVQQHRQTYQCARRRAAHFVAQLTESCRQSGESAGNQLDLREIGPDSVCHSRHKVVRNTDGLRRPLITRAAGEFYQTHLWQFVKDCRRVDYLAATAYEKVVNGGVC